METSQTKNVPAWMKKTADAKAGGNRDPNLGPGEFRLKLANIKDGIGRKSKVDYLVVTWRIVASTSPLHPIGSQAAVYYGYEFESTPGNVKRLTAALNNCTVDEVDDQVLLATFEDGASAVLGTEVLAHAENIKTEKGMDFTKITYSAILG